MQMIRYRLHEHANAELSNAFEYYNQQSIGLGSRFLDEFEKSMSIIRDNPFAGSPVEDLDARCQLIERFNYVIYYRATSDCLDVYAVAQGSRRYGYWLNRSFN